MAIHTREDQTRRVGHDGDGPRAIPEAGLDVADVIIDCADPERLASFWAGVLERPVEGRRGPYVWLQTRQGVPGIGFQRVAEAKVGKNRIHLDLSGPDLVAAKQRIEALGGRRVGGYERGGFLVMADPEGNEFCLLPSEPVDFDEHGDTTYLDDIQL